MNFFQNMISSIMKRTLRLDSLGVVEKNHELFFKTKTVQVSNEIKSLRKKITAGKL